MRSASYTLAMAGLTACLVACGQKPPAEPSPSAATPSTGGEKPSTPPAPIKSKADGVIVNNETIAYGDSEFTLPCKMEDVERVFGKASREEDESRAHFWDDLGIRTISNPPPGKDRIQNVGFFFTTTPAYKSSAAWKTKINVKNPYRMKLTFNGVSLTKDTDPNKLKSELVPLYGSSDDRWYFYLKNGGIMDIFVEDGSIAFIEVRNHKE